jgi:hypothetical protein
MPWKSREVFGKKRMPQRIKRRRFEAVTPTLAELQTKLESVRREVRNLTVTSMDPIQTTVQAALTENCHTGEWGRKRNDPRTVRRQAG